MTPPADGLDIPKLPCHDYRLYPVADQIADKVCATLAWYNGKPSSREWDLVDLIVLVTTDDLNEDKLRRAILAEARVRGIDLPACFTVPGTLGRRYSKDAKLVPACAAYPTVDLAVALVDSLLGPVFRDEVAGKTWARRALGWD